jgi:prepilin-type processing-associated H-X9-DG protein
LYNNINFNLPVSDPTNAAVNVVSPNVYQCPTDLITGSNFAVTDAVGTTVARVGVSSYAGTVGDDSSEADAPTGNGTFYRNSRTRIGDMTDGTSTTVLVGERAWALTNGSWVGAPNTALVRSGSQNPWKTATATSPVFVLVHNNWINILTDADGGLDDFSSMHVNGVQLLFADGSVRFISNITQDGPLRRAFWAMGTRAGGEVVQGLE